MYCKHCGKQIEDGFLYCPNCGGFVGEKSNSSHDLEKNKEAAVLQRDSGVNSAGLCFDMFIASILFLTLFLFPIIAMKKIIAGMFICINNFALSVVAAVKNGDSKKRWFAFVSALINLIMFCVFVILCQTFGM